MNSTASLTGRDVSEKRNATGCTGVAGGDRRLQEVGVERQQAVPGRGRSLGKIATTVAGSERGGDGVDDAQRIALSLALEVDRSAESTSRAISGHALTSALATKRASGTTAWIAMMSSHDT
jgi:hypothetical protein